MLLVGGKKPKIYFIVNKGGGGGGGGDQHPGHCRDFEKIPIIMGHRM